MTYDELKTYLENFLVDDDADFTTTVIDEVIDNAERRISKDLNIDAMIEYDTGTLTSGNHLLAKPSDWIATRSFNIITTGTTRKSIFFRTETFCDDYSPDRAVTAEPQFYANYDEVNWRFAPTPDSNYAYEAEYEVRLNGLDGSTSTTWISLNHPELLRSACLKEGAIFHMDASDKDEYEKDYLGHLERTQFEVARQRSDRNRV